MQHQSPAQILAPTSGIGSASGVASTSRNNLGAAERRLERFAVGPRGRIHRLSIVVGVKNDGSARLYLNLHALGLIDCA
jgi:hypothetical protein